MPAFKGSGEITSLSQADGYIRDSCGQERGRRGRIACARRCICLCLWSSLIMRLNANIPMPHDRSRPIRLSYSSSSTSAVCRSKAGRVARVRAAELGVAAVADGQILQPAVDEQIDQRGGGEDAVGDEIALEPVERRADHDADDHDGEAHLRIEVLAAVEVGAAADGAAIDVAARPHRVPTHVSGMSRPHPPHLITARRSARRSPAAPHRTGGTWRRYSCDAVTSGKKRRQRQIPHRVEAGRGGEHLRDRVDDDRRRRDVAVDAAGNLHRQRAGCRRSR